MPLPLATIECTNMDMLCTSVYGADMSKTPSRVNVLLDEEHAAKLYSLAARTYVSPGTIARSLLSRALDHADPDPATVTALLDAIPGAYERAQQGQREASMGLSIPLDDL